MTECPKCERLMELYERTPKTPRDYWLITELFVLLHGGDVCPAAYGTSDKTGVFGGRPDEPGMYMANAWFGMWDGKQWVWGGPPTDGYVSFGPCAEVTDD